MALELEIRQQGGWTVIALEGHLDAATAGELLSAIEDLPETATQRLALDLAAVPYVSSAGLRALLRALKAARRHHGSMRLVAPTAAVYAVLAACGFTDLFEIRSHLDPDG